VERDIMFALKHHVRNKGLRELPHCASPIKFTDI
jgi:hypothetical protein